MKGFILLWSILIGLVLPGCKQDSSGAAGTDLDAIKTVQELKLAEQKIDEASLQDPAYDRTAEYAQLAEKAESLSRLLDAERLYQKSLWGHSTSEDRQTSLSGLMALYRDRLHYTQVGQMICCAGDAEALTCCPQGGNEPDSLQLLLRKQIIADSTGEFSRQGGREYIAFAQTYALLHPDRSTSPSYLNEAAKLALSLRMPSKGIELFQWIYLHFPDSEAAPKARFLEAFTYENELKDLDSAKRAYEAYLEQYPNDVFAKDARILLDNLGVDPEEMIRRIQNQ